MSTSKIKINPVTREIEIEVSEEFLLKYFESLGIFLISSNKIKLSKSEKTIDKKTKTIKKPRAPKGAIQGAVIDAIKKGKDGGVTIKDIVEETGLDKSKINPVLTKAKKEGIIKAIKRGVFEYVKPVV